MRFLVRATEYMETLYVVDAPSETEAREMVEKLGPTPDGVEQLDASVFEVEVRSVEVQ